MRKKRVIKVCLLFVSTAMILGFSGKDSPAQEINPEEGLILYLPFNGNALDESGNNVHTYAKGPILTHDRHGNLLEALTFDGVNDFIELNHNQALITGKEFTICMWARIIGRSKVPFGHSNTLFSQAGQVSDTALTIHFDADQNRRTRLELIGIQAEDSLELSTEYPGDHLWHHFLCTLDESNTLHIYIDGQMRISRLFTSDADFLKGVSSVRIGSYLPGYQYYGAFYGDIDEVCIYNRALSPCEAETLYSGQLLQER